MTCIYPCGYLPHGYIHGDMIQGWIQSDHK